MQSHLSEKLGQAIYASMFCDEIHCWSELVRIIASLEQNPREFTDPDAIRWVTDIKGILKRRQPEPLGDEERRKLRTAIWELYCFLGTNDVDLFAKTK